MNTTEGGKEVCCGVVRVVWCGVVLCVVCDVVCVCLPVVVCVRCLSLLIEKWADCISNLHA